MLENVLIVSQTRTSEPLKIALYRCDYYYFLILEAADLNIVLSKV